MTEAVPSDRGHDRAMLPGRGHDRAMPVVVVHGGAGNRRRDRDQLVAGCRRAAKAGLAVLVDGGTPLDAVEQAVRQLEDDPVFNAGTGAALSAAGRIELDASIMDGTSLAAGGIAVLPPFSNPISVARAVLEDGQHVLYAGRGAEAFALEHGFEPASLDAMVTEASRQRLERWLERAEAEGGKPPDSLSTVGAVAVDHAGHVAAATSTGGTVGQRPGRIGDSPIIGAGTYADDDYGACSATGEGESILRAVLAHSAVDLVARAIPAPEAATAAVARFEQRFGGRGGLILVDNEGNVGIANSTSLMSHAVARPGAEVIADA